MPGYVTTGGYQQVLLRQRGFNRPDMRVLVHRLVAHAFVPGAAPDLQVNHLNGNKLDNRADNLEWTTASKNQRHRIYTLGHKGGLIKNRDFSDRHV